LFFICIAIIDEPTAMPSIVAPNNLLRRDQEAPKGSSPLGTLFFAGVLYFLFVSVTLTLVVHEQRTKGSVNIERVITVKKKSKNHNE
jgi:hypothetical protein